MAFPKFFSFLILALNVWGEEGREQGGYHLGLYLWQNGMTEGRNVLKMADDWSYWAKGITWNRTISFTEPENDISDTSNSSLKCGIGTSSISVTWEMVRNAKLHTFTPDLENNCLYFYMTPSNSHAHSSLRSAILGLLVLELILFKTFSDAL